MAQEDVIGVGRRVAWRCGKRVMMPFAFVPGSFSLSRKRKGLCAGCQVTPQLAGRHIRGFRVRVCGKDIISICVDLKM
jgi:hypothetical protein